MVAATVYVWCMYFDVKFPLVYTSRAFGHALLITTSAATIMSLVFVL